MVYIKWLGIEPFELAYNDEINIYEIASIGKKDSGLILMAMEMSDIEGSSGKKMIELIWKTLEIK